MEEARVGLGCMALTGIYGKVERRDAIGVIQRAFDLGIRHFDTAELYGPYENEILLAEALGPHRLKANIATKFGYKIVNRKIVGLDSQPNSIRRAVEGSLRRLKRDRIDLLYQHRADPNVPIEDVVGTMSELIIEGKVAELGLSNTDKPTLDRARSVYSIAAIQNEYSIVHRTPEIALAPSLVGLNTKFVAFSPLARGLLCGNSVSGPKRGFDDYRRSAPAFSENSINEARSQLNPLWKISQQRRTTSAAVALAWLMSKNEMISVIPGAKTTSQISQCISASAIRLTKEEIQKLDNIGKLATPNVQHV